MPRVRLKEPRWEQARAAAMRATLDSACLEVAETSGHKTPAWKQFLGSLPQAPAASAAERKPPTPPASPKQALEALSEEGLAVLTAQGVEGAWEALYARIWPWAMETANHYAQAQGWSEDDASDWAQESLLRAWKYRSRYRPSTGYRTWLRRIIFNEIGQARRLSKRRSALLEKSGYTGPTTNANFGEGFWYGESPPSAEEGLLRAEDRMLLREALLQLKEEDRMLLVLWAEKRLDDYRNPDGSECPADALRKRVHRAKSRLREVVQRIHKEAS